MLFCVILRWVKGGMGSWITDAWPFDCDSADVHIRKAVCTVFSNKRKGCVLNTTAIPGELHSSLSTFCDDSFVNCSNREKKHRGKKSPLCFPNMVPL